MRAVALHAIAAPIGRTILAARVVAAISVAPSYELGGPSQQGEDFDMS